MPTSFCLFFYWGNTGMKLKLIMSVRFYHVTVHNPCLVSFKLIVGRGYHLKIPEPLRCGLVPFA